MFGVGLGVAIPLKPTGPTAAMVSAAAGLAAVKAKSSTAKEPALDSLARPTSRFESRGTTRQLSKTADETALVADKWGQH